MQCAEVCCSVLQCVAVCCSVLQCVAVCCSVLQCVAVCCSDTTRWVDALRTATCNLRFNASCDSPAKRASAYACMSMSHVNQSCCTSEWVSRVAHMDELCCTYGWVMSHIWMSHVTHMNESCHAYDWVMSHIRIRHVPLTSCPTWYGVASMSRLLKITGLFCKRAI